MKTSEKIKSEKAGTVSEKFFFQPKASVNKAGDVYEQEADYISEKVLNRKDLNSNDHFFKPAININYNIQRQEKEPETEDEKKDKTTVPDEFDSRIDYFEMTKPFYNRGATSMLQFDDRIGKSVGYAWNNNYKFFFSFGFGDNLSADAANFFTPFAIDSALKNDFPSASEIFERDADISSIVISPTVFSFDLQDIPGTIRMPFLNIFGADKSNPYSSKKRVHRKCKDCEEEKIQKKELNNESSKADQEFENYAGNLDTGGKALGQEERNFFEPRFGYDFSEVKIHDDPAAAKSAQSINALAYTTGSNIVFNQDQFSPGTDSGKRLLAHELTHVLQQSERKNPASIFKKENSDDQGIKVMRKEGLKTDCDVKVDPRDEIDFQLSKSVRTIGSGKPVITDLIPDLKKNNPCLYEASLTHENQHALNAAIPCGEFKKCVDSHSSPEYYFWGENKISRNDFIECHNSNTGGKMADCISDEKSAYEAGISKAKELVLLPKCSAEVKSLNDNIKFWESIKSNSPNCSK